MMKKILVTMFALCGVSQADINPVLSSVTNYDGMNLNHNIYAYAYIDVPMGRGVVGSVVIGGAQASGCQNERIVGTPSSYQEVCPIGKKESYEQSVDIKVFKNSQVIDTATIVYSKSSVRRTR